MKRARPQQEHSDGPEEAFKCSLSSCSGGALVSVFVPDAVLATAPVLSEMAQLAGTTAIQHRTECVLAWLAWLAHWHSQAGHGERLPWDGDADALTVRTNLYCKSLWEHLCCCFCSAICSVPSVPFYARSTLAQPTGEARRDCTLACVAQPVLVIVPILALTLP